MKKKAVSALLCATMVAGMLAGCGKGSDSGTPSDTSKGDASNATESASSNLKDDGKVLNIYCWNEEFKSRLYYRTLSGLQGSGCNTRKNRRCGCCMEHHTE